MDEAVKRVGIDILSEIIKKTKDTPSPGPRGFHFYTLNLEKVVTQILEKCDLIPPSTPPLLNAPPGGVIEEAVAEEETDGFHDSRGRQAKTSTAAVFHGELTTSK